MRGQTSSSFVSLQRSMGRRSFAATRAPVRDKPKCARRRMENVTRELAHLSDEAIVAWMARSDEVAFAELYDRFGRIAWGLCRRVLRDDALAEDGVQEAFLTAWRTASRFVPERGTAG